MEKITGTKRPEELPEKVALLYRAVLKLIEEGADIANIKVSDITDRAGIGKGTAYDYFHTKEEIIVSALLFYMENMMQELTRHIWERKSFEERLNLVMDTMEGQPGQSACMLRFVSLLCEPSRVGQLLRETIAEQKKGGRCQPLLLGRQVIERGIADGEIREDLPVSYLTYLLVTKFIACYAYEMNRRMAAQGGAKEADASFEGEISGREFRELVRKGILEEFAKKDRNLKIKK